MGASTRRLSESLAYDPCLAAGADGALAAISGHGMCMPSFQRYYDQAGQGGSTGQTDLPAYSVEALKVEHVQTAVRFASERGIAVSIKTSGHSYAGGSMLKGTLLIFLRLLKESDYGIVQSFTDSCGTTFDPAMKIGGGQVWGDAYRYVLEAGKYTLPGGGSTNVGAAGGWLQGFGESGWGTRFYGFGVDYVHQFEVVLADGRFVRADACSESDLFWALRGGGGGSFGVVTAVHYKLFPKTKLVLAGLTVGTDMSIEFMVRSTRCADQTTGQIADIRDCFAPDHRDFVDLLYAWLDAQMVGGAFDLLNLDPRWSSSEWALGFTPGGAISTGSTTGMKAFQLYFNGPLEELLADEDNLINRMEAWVQTLDPGLVAKYDLRFGYAELPTIYYMFQFPCYHNFAFPWMSLEQNQAWVDPSITEAELPQLKANFANQSAWVWGSLPHLASAQTSCDMFGAAGSWYGNSDAAIYGRSWTLPCSLLANKTRARQVLIDSFFKTLDFGLFSNNHLLGGTASKVHDDAVHPGMRGGCASIQALTSPLMTYERAVFSEGAPDYNHHGDPVALMTLTGGTTYDDAMTVYHGEHLPRLKQVKKKYDPAGRFNSWQAIGYKAMPSKDLTPGCGSIAFDESRTAAGPACATECVCKDKATDSARRKLLFASQGGGGVPAAPPPSPMATSPSASPASANPPMPPGSGPQHAIEAGCESAAASTCAAFP